MLCVFVVIDTFPGVQNLLLLHRSQDAKRSDSVKTNIKNKFYDLFPGSTQR